MPATHLSSHLLSRFPAVRSNDLEEVRKQVADVFCDHELRLVGGQRNLNTQMHYRPLQKVGYGRMLYGAAVDIDPGQLHNFFLVQILLRGEETIFAGSQPFRSTARLASIISPTIGFRMRHEKDTEKLFLRIDRDAFERKCAQYCGRPLSKPLEFTPGIPLDSPAGRSLRQLALWQITQASEGLLFDHPLVAAQLEDTLMLALLDTLPHNQVYEDRLPAPLTPQFVRRAEEYIHQNAHQAISTGDIAQHAGVSARTLYAGFRKHRDTTPMAYLKAVRLDHVHDVLSAGGSQLNVTRVALEWGFSHLGQFSADYQRRHGQLPSETLRKARS